MYKLELKANNNNNFKQFIKDPIISRFINKIMKNGNKAVAEKIIKKVLFFFKNKTNKNPFKIMHLAFYKIRPFFGIQLLKRRRSTTEIPFILKSHYRYTLIFRWILESANKLNYNKFYKKIAYTILNIFNNNTTNSAFVRKEELEKKVKNNLAFVKNKRIFFKIYNKISNKKNIRNKKVNKLQTINNISFKNNF